MNCETAYPEIVNMAGKSVANIDSQVQKNGIIALVTCVDSDAPLLSQSLDVLTKDLSQIDPNCQIIVACDGEFDTPYSFPNTTTLPRTDNQTKGKLYRLGQAISYIENRYRDTDALPKTTLFFDAESFFLPTVTGLFSEYTNTNPAGILSARVRHSAYSDNLPDLSIPISLEFELYNLIQHLMGLPTGAGLIGPTAAMLGITKTISEYLPGASTDYTLATIAKSLDIPITISSNVEVTGLVSPINDSKASTLTTRWNNLSYSMARFSGIQIGNYIEPLTYSKLRKQAIVTMMQKSIKSEQKYRGSFYASFKEVYKVALNTIKHRLGLPILHKLDYIDPTKSSNSVWSRSRQS